MCNDCEVSAVGRLNRRRFINMSSVFAGAVALSAPPIRALADECTPFLADAQAATTPDQAIQMVVEGNSFLLRESRCTATSRPM